MDSRALSHRSSLGLELLWRSHVLSVDEHDGHTKARPASQVLPTIPAMPKHTTTHRHRQLARSEHDPLESMRQRRPRHTAWGPFAHLKLEDNADAFVRAFLTPEVPVETVQLRRAGGIRACGGPQALEVQVMVSCDSGYVRCYCAFRGDTTLVTDFHLSSDQPPRRSPNIHAMRQTRIASLNQAT